MKWWQKALLILGPLLVFAIVVPLLMYAYFALTMGDMTQLMNRNNTGVVLLDKNGEKFFSTGTAEHRDIVPLDKISEPMKKAVIASEDKNFYNHSGVNILSTLRAVYGYVFGGGKEFGGSTLTQQLAKITVLSTNRGFLRQYQAMSVALAIEQRYSKDEILTMYLNTVYFGENAFGVEAAAKNYFGKTPAELTLAESSMLAGLLPAPSKYSPISGDLKLAKEHQAEVLKRMAATGAITESQKTEAQAISLSYRPRSQRVANDAPHFTEMVLAELYQKYGEEEVKRSGMQVTTSLDMKLQRTANQSVANRRAYLARMGGSNASVVAIDPKTFEIRALVGSVDYNNMQWGAVNMAITPRQLGSSFKPIYYAAALADGAITPSTQFKDEPINVSGYSPKNATRRYYGDVTARKALAWSLNIPAVKIMQQYGVGKSIQAARNLGIELGNDTVNKGLSLALGSAEAPLAQMTGAYATFANSGQRADQTTIREVKDKFNKVIYRHQLSLQRKMSAEGAYLISNILSDQNARAGMFGSSLSVNGKTAAVKTGTTDDNRDAWTIGYTPDMAVGVWAGNNDNSAMVNGGVNMAGPIWRSIMLEAIGQNNPTFVKPGGVVERSVCFNDGGLANFSGQGTYQEFFLSGHLPQPGSCQAKVEEKPSDQNTNSGNASNEQQKEQDDSPTDNSNTGSDSGSDSDTAPNLPDNNTNPAPAQPDPMPSPTPPDDTRPIIP